MAVAFGLDRPFAPAGRLLDEAASWTVGDEALRRLCHAEAATVAGARAERLAPAEAFAAAPGDRELQVDAGKVNTPEGWRDVKLAAFARRERAEPSGSADYEQRDLLAPSARSVVAAVETAEAFGRRCRDEAARRGGPAAASLSVLGDGAEWTWNLAGGRFAGAEQVLDVFHAAASGRSSNCAPSPTTQSGTATSRRPDCQEYKDTTRRSTWRTTRSTRRAGRSCRRAQ